MQIRYPLLLRRGEVLEWLESIGYSRWRVRLMMEDGTIPKKTGLYPGQRRAYYSRLDIERRINLDRLEQEKV